MSVSRSNLLSGVRVLVAEPDALVALALAAAVATHGGDAVVARTLPAARARIDEPWVIDVAIASARPRCAWGLELSAVLRQRDPPCASLLLVNEATALREVIAGAPVGLLAPPWSLDDVATGLHRAWQATRRLRREAQAPSSARLSTTLEHAIVEVARARKLSTRERSVFRGLVLGRSHREIADDLAISPRTVKMYAAHLRAKTEAGSRADLMRLLLEG